MLHVETEDMSQLNSHGVDINRLQFTVLKL
jgi:hypothetical protein